MERFLIPVFFKNKIFTNGELIKPKGGVLADAEKAPNDMTGIVRLVSGCLSSITDSAGEVISNKKEIEEIIKHMAYQAAEYLAMKIFAKRSDGAIEQIVYCPRCKNRYIYEFINDELDDRIKFDDLKIGYYEKAEMPEILIELDSPVEIKNAETQEVINKISYLTFRFPTMNDGSFASMKIQNDTVRRQYQMYASAMTQINGEAIDSKFRNIWGMFIFDRMDTDDIEKISDELKKYGLNKTLNRTCSDCDKNFDFTVDTAGFFA